MLMKLIREYNYAIYLLTTYLGQKVNLRSNCTKLFFRSPI